MDQKAIEAWACYCLVSPPLATMMLNVWPNTSKMQDVVEKVGTTLANSSITQVSIIVAALVEALSSVP